MAILNEGRRTAEFLVSEGNDYISRDEVTVTVPANTTLEAGSILGKITATGKFVRHDAGASNGSEDEAGLLLVSQLNTTAGPLDFTAANVARSAEVHGNQITYEDGADAAQITASNAALAALGLIVR